MAPRTKEPQSRTSAWRRLKQLRVANEALTKELQREHNARVRAEGQRDQLRDAYDLLLTRLGTKVEITQ